MQSGRSMTSQPLMERSRQVMTFLAAPDQKVALLVIPGWADAVPALLVLLVPWSPQEPKQSLLMQTRTSQDNQNWPQSQLCYGSQITFQDITTFTSDKC